MVAVGDDRTDPVPNEPYQNSSAESHKNGKYHGMVGFTVYVQWEIFAGANFVELYSPFKRIQVYFFTPLLQ